MLLAWREVKSKVLWTTRRVTESSWRKPVNYFNTAASFFLPPNPSDRWLFTNSEVGAVIEKLLAFITTFESGHEVLTKCQALALPYEWRVMRKNENIYYFPCIDVYFLVCPLTFSYAKLNERRQINHNLINKPPIIFRKSLNRSFHQNPPA